MCVAVTVIRFRIINYEFQTSQVSVFIHSVAFAVLYAIINFHIVAENELY